MLNVAFSITLSLTLKSISFLFANIKNIFSIISSVLQNWPPIRYIVAVEQELISQNMIIKVPNFPATLPRQYARYSHLAPFHSAKRKIIKSS